LAASGIIEGGGGRNMTNLIASMLMAGVLLAGPGATRTYSHRYFTLEIPAGWRVAGEVPAGDAPKGQPLVTPCAGGVRLVDGRGRYFELLVAPPGQGACSDGWWCLSVTADRHLRTCGEKKIATTCGPEPEGDDEVCGCMAEDGKLTMGGVAYLSKETTVFIWFGHEAREKDVSLGVFRSILASVHLTAEAAAAMPPP
jgi:hypothetical protein